MNESWRNSDADAHHAKAEACAVAIDAIKGLSGAVDALEQATLDAAVAVLARARDRHEVAARLVEVPA